MLSDYSNVQLFSELLTLLHIYFYIVTRRVVRGFVGQALII